MSKKKKRRSTQNKHTRPKHIATKVPNTKHRISPSHEVTLDEFEQELKFDLGQQKEIKKEKEPKKELKFNNKYLSNCKGIEQLKRNQTENKSSQVPLNSSVRDLSEEKKILENILSEKTSIQENMTNKSERNNKLKQPKRKHLGTALKIFLFLAVVVIVSILFIASPKIELNGDSKIVLTYNQEYKESGAKASYLGQNISEDIKITGQVDTSKVGEYEVTYEVERFIFHTKKKRKIQVVDQQSPTLELEGELEVNICPNGEYQEVGYHAYDEYDGDLTEKVQVEKKSDRYIYTVSDSSGNSAQKERLIKQVDQEKPTITLKGGSTIYITPNSAFQEPGYTATDNCEGDITSKVKVSGQVSPSKLGTYSLTYTVSDQAGNTATVVRTVIVSERTDPDSGVSKAGVIYLTFDDGPSAATTGEILDILKEEGVKATFFVTNNGPDELIKRAYDEGHTIGLHTASHRYDQVYASVDNYFNDLKVVSDRVKRITGHESKIIRFPGGSSNTVSKKYSQGIMTTLTEAVLNQGYRYYDWNVDASDAWQCAKSSVSNKKQCVYDNVTKGLSKSRANIVLMHDIKPHTRDALRDIIRYGKENGYTFEAIDMNTKMVKFKVIN